MSPLSLHNSLDNFVELGLDPVFEVGLDLVHLGEFGKGQAARFRGVEVHVDGGANGVHYFPQQETPIFFNMLVR
jgi:hypothetical protein